MYSGLFHIIFYPLVKYAIEVFRVTWNIHYCRRHAHSVLPKGRPQHIFHYPSFYNKRSCFIPVPRQQILFYAVRLGVHQDQPWLTPAEERKAYSILFAYMNFFNIQQITYENAFNVYGDIAQRIISVL